MKQPIEDRLSALLKHNAHMGDFQERSVVGTQIGEAIAEIIALRAEIKTLMERRGYARKIGTITYDPETGEIGITVATGGGEDTNA